MKSPIPTKKPQTNLDFYAALKEIMTGKSVTKKEWGNRAIYGILKDGHVMFHKEGKYYEWILSDGDVYGEDYYVL